MFSARPQYNSYYYNLNDDPVDDQAAPLVDGSTNRGTPFRSFSTIQGQQDGQSSYEYGEGDMFGAHDINSDILDYTNTTKSPGLIEPSSPRPSPSYSTPDRFPNVSEPYDAAWKEMSPLWQARRTDNMLPGSTSLAPVLPASTNVSAPAPSSSDWTCAPEHTWNEFEDSLPSPVPSCESEASEPLSSLSSPRVPPSETPSLPSPASSRPPQPPTIASTPAADSSKSATGKEKKKDKVGIIPQDLIDTLKASPFYEDKVISKVFERKGGYYWTVSFTDGEMCCVCNVSGSSCRRICTNSRGINRHFKAAPHRLGNELDCNHPTHPCGRSFFRRDVLKRHLTTPHPVVRRQREEDGGEWEAGFREEFQSGKKEAI